MLDTHQRRWRWDHAPKTCLVAPCVPREIKGTRPWSGHQNLSARAKWCCSSRPRRSVDKKCLTRTSVVRDRMTLLECIAFLRMTLAEWIAFLNYEAGVDDEVVAFAVAIGAGDAEAEVRGFEDEGEFGEFSAALGGEFALAGSLRGGLFLDGLCLDGLCLDGLCSDRLCSDKIGARR